MDVQLDNPDTVWTAKKVIAVSDGSMDPVSGLAVFLWVITKEGDNAKIK